MASGGSMMPQIAEQLGPGLYTACLQNDVAQVKLLASNNTTTNWSAALIAAGLAKAIDVAAYCMQSTSSKTGIQDEVVIKVSQNDDLDPAYQFLVDSNIVEVGHGIDHMGQMLGILAGSHKSRRHSMVKYLLDKGADPNQAVFMHGDIYVLTAAAGNSDQGMVGILLDQGAEISGTGALIRAAERGNEENVRYLLARGADVNEITPFSHSIPSMEAAGSALHKAVENDHLAVIDILLNAGADVILKDAKGETPADIAARKGMAPRVLGKLS